MNPTEWRAVVCLGLVYALRMVGMFMILPVFALYAGDLEGEVSPMTIGLAIGIYGLAQAVLQIPLGLLSDRIGRKTVIFLGMTVFAVGSVVAGLATSIEGVIVGRALQGAGAVSSAVAALLADVTRDQVRTTAMAIVGVGMGAAFVIALVAGPVVSGWIGVDGIFLLTAVLALLSLPVVGYGVPTPAIRPRLASGFSDVLRDGELLRLDAGIFILHAMMTALFTTVPFAIAETLSLPGDQHWQVYLPVLVLSILPVFPLIRWAEARGHTRWVFRAAVALLGISMALAAITHGQALGLFAALIIFFIGFNYLEGALPSMISRRAPAQLRGAALGAYASSQFLGAFCGGILGGTALSLGGISGSFALCAVLPIIWLLIPVANPLREPAPATTT